LGVTGLLFPVVARSSSPMTGSDGPCGVNYATTLKKETVQVKSLTLQVHYSPGMVSSQWYAIGDSDEITRSTPVDAAFYAKHPDSIEVFVGSLLPTGHVTSGR
jgi:hypothetical protein